MGQEFCKGCEDCSNFCSKEGDLSQLGNKPIEKLNNPYFGNNYTDNSVINKDYQNETSFLTNINENMNNINKNEALQIASLYPKKNNNDLPENLLINGQNYQRENEEIFKQKNEDNEINKDKNEENINLNDSNYNDYNDENIFKNNNNNEVNENDIDEVDEVDKERLKEIIQNYNAKIITKLFKKLILKKKESHKILYTENGIINDINYIQNNIRNDYLNVNLCPDQNFLYIGTKFNSKKDGLGLEIFSLNAKYFGRFINNKRVYLGRFIINNNNTSYYYYGEIKGLYAYGFGLHENYKESIYYEGMWINSKKEGYGIEIYNKENSIYKGQFSNGKKNGIGHYSWNDNSSYIGEWSEGVLQGYGIYHFPDGSFYTGSWVNNQMNGFGEFTYPEIKSYLGYFESDKRCGFGILIWYKVSKVFIGFWKENKQNGLGKFISNGKIVYGLWENGAIKEKIEDENIFIKQLENQENNFFHFFKYNNYENVLEKVKNIISL